jgi:DNA-binding MarR family transcriptional regulator
MSDLLSNAHRMLGLFAEMRDTRPGPAFEALKQLNLSLSHMRTLQLLTPDRTLAMKDLAEHLQMTPPSVTAITRRLVQTGLVQRTTHAEDSRVVLLSLTDAGRALYEQVTQEHIDRMVRLLGGLSADEQQQFLDLLERAVHAMRAADRAADDSSDDLRAATPQESED